MNYKPCTECRSRGCMDCLYKCSENCSRYICQKCSKKCELCKKIMCVYCHTIVHNCFEVIFEE